jgi:hypothetical protein
MMTRQRASRISSLFLAALACMALGSARSASAGPTPVLDAHITSGVDQELTVVGRLLAGGILVFDRIQVGLDAHLSFEGFLRIASDEGVAARSFGLLNLGARYGFRNARFHGPYMAAGGGFGLFSGKPRERKIKGDIETCDSADIPAGEPLDQCTFAIDKNVNAHVGLGWGFASGKRTTVGVRLDFTYWLFSVADFEDQPQGAPIPRQIPRPQDAWSVMIGLEFMRWR